MTQTTCAATEGTLQMGQSACECAQDGRHDAQSGDAGCDAAAAAARGCFSSFLPLPLLSLKWWVKKMLMLLHQLPHYCFLPHCPDDDVC